MMDYFFSCRPRSFVLTVVSLVTLVYGCKTPDQGTSSGKSVIIVSDLNEVLQNSMTITVNSYGQSGWLPNRSCTGMWTISVSRDSNRIQVSGCIENQTKKSELLINDAEKEYLQKILSSWKTEPVPRSAFKQPCPTDMLGGFSASAVNREGTTSSFSMYVCIGLFADGILIPPTTAEGSRDTRLQEFIESLLGASDAKRQEQSSQTLKASNLAELAEKALSLTFHIHMLQHRGGHCSNYWFFTVEDHFNRLDASYCYDRKWYSRAADLTPQEKNELENLLSQWKIKPLPANAFTEDCPKFDGRLAFTYAKLPSERDEVRYHRFTCKGTSEYLRPHGLAIPEVKNSKGIYEFIKKFISQK